MARARIVDRSRATLWRDLSECACCDPKDVELRLNRVKPAFGSSLCPFLGGGASGQVRRQGALPIVPRGCEAGRS